MSKLKNWWRRYQRRRAALREESEYFHGRRAFRSGDYRK